MFYLEWLDFYVLVGNIYVFFFFMDFLFWILVLIVYYRSCSVYGYFEVLEEVWWCIDVVVGIVRWFVYYWYWLIVVVGGWEYFLLISLILFRILIVFLLVM